MTASIKAKIVIDTSELDRLSSGGGMGGGTGISPVTDPDSPKNSLKTISKDIFSLLRLQRVSNDLEKAGGIGKTILEALGIVELGVAAAGIGATGIGAATIGAVGEGLPAQMQTEGEFGTGTNRFVGAGGFEGEQQTMRESMGLTQEDVFEQGINQPTETIHQTLTDLDEALSESVVLTDEMQDIIEQNVNQAILILDLDEDIYDKKTRTASLIDELNKIIEDEIKAGARSIFGTKQRTSRPVTPFEEKRGLEPGEVQDTSPQAFIDRAFSSRDFAKQTIFQKP